MSEEVCKFLQEVLAAKPVGGKSVYFYDGEAYEVDQNFNPPRVKKVELGEEIKEAAEKTIELIKQSGYDKTLKELEKK